MCLFACTFGSTRSTGECIGNLRPKHPSYRLSPPFPAARAGGPGLPLAGLLDEVLNRGVRLCAWGDNDTALLTVRKGFTRRLAYLRKTQRIGTDFRALSPWPRMPVSSIGGHAGWQARCCCQ